MWTLAHTEVGSFRRLTCSFCSHVPPASGFSEALPGVFPGFTLRLPGQRAGNSVGPDTGGLFQPAFSTVNKTVSVSLDSGCHGVAE